VAGVEGELVIREEWPDSLQGLAVVALDQLYQLELSQLREHLIAYSDPLLAGGEHLPFFLQLYPGGFYLVPVGLTVDPPLFIANLDSFLALPNPPITLIGSDPVRNIRAVLVQEETVTTLPEPWELTFE
jgi:hypothetical protein